MCKSLNFLKPTANILQQNYLQPQQKKSTDLFLKQKYKATAPSNHPNTTETNTLFMVCIYRLYK